MAQGGMHLKHVLMRTAACLAVAVGTVGGAGVHTAAAVSVSDPCGGANSDTIDPILTQNKLTAIPNATRPYADICTVTATKTTTEIDYSVSVAAPIPSFPVASNGDIGVNFAACIDVDPGFGLANGPTQIGTGCYLPPAARLPRHAFTVVGPIPSVGRLPFTVDWAPGEQLCTTPVLACIDNPGGFTLGLAPLGFPISAVVDCDVAALQKTCPTPIVGTVNYDWCQATSSTSGQDESDLHAVAPAACSGALVTPLPYPYEAVN